MLYHEVRGRLERATVVFCNGFWEVMQTHKVFDAQQLELLMCGRSDLDVEEWRSHTKYGEGYSAHYRADPTIRVALKTLRPELLERPGFVSALQPLRSAFALRLST